MAPVHLRVFLSSPSDVAAERAVATEVLESLPREAAWRGRVTIEIISWDDPSAPASLVATMPPQQAVVRVLPPPSECDLTVVILWSRMGTPLDGERKANGSPYLSGTEWEFHDAVNHDRPVLLYRKTEEILTNIKDSQFGAKRRQAQLVDEFFAGFQNPDGSARRSYASFGNARDFRSLLKSHIEHELRLLTDDARLSARTSEKPLAGSIAPRQAEAHSATPAVLSHDLGGLVQVSSGRGRTEAFQDIVQRATSRILIVGAGMTNLARYARRTLTARASRVPIDLLMLDPALLEEDASWAVRLQNFFDIPDFAAAVRSSHDTLRRFAMDWNSGEHEHQIRLRVYRTIPTRSIVVVDPDDRSGELMVEFFLYQSGEYRPRLHVRRVDVGDSLFDKLQDECVRLWNDSIPVV